MYFNFCLFLLFLNLVIYCMFYKFKFFLLFFYLKIIVLSFKSFLSFNEKPFLYRTRHIDLLSYLTQDINWRSKSFYGQLCLSIKILLTYFHMKRIFFFFTVRRLSVLFIAIWRIRIKKFNNIACLVFLYSKISLI